MVVLTMRNDGFVWFTQNGVYVKGYLFDKLGRYYAKEQLLGYFTDARDKDAFTQKLRGANGQFAVVVETDRYLFGAVDRLRSIPLFYCNGAFGIHIADEVPVLLKYTGTSTVSIIAREEFLRRLYRRP